MRIRVVASLSVLTVFLFGALTARANTELAKAQIPFQFVVGAQVLPAGEYTVMRLDNSRMAILVRSTDGTQAVFSTAMDMQPKENAPWVFVFKRYGSSDYFLQNILLGPSESGLQLPHSKRERELMSAGMTQTRVELAAEIR
jgi:hypothetical protein